MVRETRSIFIEAPVETVYGYWTDPDNWSAIAPAWARVQNANIKKTPEVAGTTFDSYGRMIPGLPRMKFSVEFLEAEPNRRLVMRSDGPSGMATMTALFDSVGSGTVLTASEGRELTALERLPLIGRLTGPAIEQLDSRWMHGLKAKLEEEPLERSATEASSRTDLTVELPDGTVLGYADVGDPGGQPVLFMHGTPTSRLDATWPAFSRAAERLGVRLLALDRPGIGLSNFQRYALVDYPRLVAGFADALGLKSFAVMGHSGGTKFVCACAWALPDRVTRAVPIATPAPVDLPGVKATWSRDVRLLNMLAVRSPWLLRLLLATFARDCRRGRLPKVLMSTFEDSPSDKAILAQGFEQFTARCFAEAVRQGLRGAAQDQFLEARPWGFPLADVDTPTVIWHGEEDPDVSVDEARILARALSHVTLHVLPGEGHLLIAGNHIAEILGSALES